MILKGNIVDIPGRRIFPGQLTIKNGIISSIEKLDEIVEGYIMPGFVDAHVHIESSLLTPGEFARMAVIHGTVATVSDPHEIANVLGIEGVKFMIENSKTVPFHFFFGAPSCVPATIFETAGATIDSNQIEELLQNNDIHYLAEMMNFPGVLHEDSEVMAKLHLAKKYSKPIDGHAPGLTGEDAKKYIDAGPSTDHECFTLEEALGKISYGMKVIIREGSAARNFDALHPLINNYSDKLMFCSDDKHPDSLVLGHINQLVSRSVALGYDVFDVLKVACINPVSHYKLDVGQLKIGDPADFIMTYDLIDFKVSKTFIKGEIVASEGESKIPRTSSIPINHFNIETLTLDELEYDSKQIENVIECLDGQLITNNLIVAKESCTPGNDILKIVVVNRYHKAPAAKAFIKNFGLKKGAMASSVAHDSHNIIAVGVTDEDMLEAINIIIRHKGGLSASYENVTKVLPLPVAGLMSNDDAWDVAEAYTELDNFSKEVLGSTLRAPYMSLSFMALLVIPELKLSDKGLFDGAHFRFI